MDLKQQQKLAQRMSLTPQMKQSLKLLQLPLFELKEYLQAQVEENPVLEQARQKEGPEELISAKKLNKLLELSERSKDPTNYNSPNQTMKEMQDKQRYRENIITKGICLHDNLIGQLRLLKLTPLNFIIAEAIISDIDENGYLLSSLDQLTALIKKHPLIKEKKISKKNIEDMLAVVQTFEPVGIAARNLKECLLIQLKAKNIKNQTAHTLICSHLVDIAKNKTATIAKKLKKPVCEIKEAMKIISFLEPKPGRIFDSQEMIAAKSSIPDVILEKNEGKLEVIINTRWLPTLSINKHYKKLLKSDETTDSVKEYLNQKIKSATWLIKTLSQRDETIRKISECILSMQGDFLQSGNFAHIKPLTLKQVAKKIGRNESTISRVVSSKYIRTPVGTYKLNSFFSSHLSTEKGEKISTEHIKSLINDIIEDEPPQKPLRDNAIAKALKNKGIQIARRTVAKYREELDIPPYHQRKTPT
jgi:RNA polymerase sigma-54 factor